MYVVGDCIEGNVGNISFWWLEKEYLHSYWISGANIWMAGGQGGDLSARKGFLCMIRFLMSFMNFLKMSELLSCFS